jgi:hypothetical protein
MASMIKNKMISGIHFVESLTMTFMPTTDDSDVIGRARTDRSRYPAFAVFEAPSLANCGGAIAVC